MGQIWRQSEVTQFFASVGRVIDQKWSKRPRSEENELILCAFNMMDLPKESTSYKLKEYWDTRFSKEEHLSGAKGMVILKICYASTWEKAIAY